MQERVTFETNRLDLYARRWLGSDSDDNRRKIILWNFAWFKYSPTFWLPVGRLFWISEPLPSARPVLAFGMQAISFPDRGHHILIGLPVDVEG